jgi:hypothetical protein
MITGIRPDDSAPVSATPKEPDDLLRRSEFLLGAVNFSITASVGLPSKRRRICRHVTRDPRRGRVGKGRRID